MVDIIVLYYILMIPSIISIPLYTAILAMLILLRRRSPFNGSFFTLTISTAIFDLLHLFVVWFLERSARFNWLGITTSVMLASTTVSKLQTYLWWYSAFGQKLGTMLTALNRLMVIVFNKEWKGNIMRFFLIMHWLLPIILASPKLTLDFDYMYVNNTQDGVMVVQLSQSIWQGYYCFSACFAVGLLCALCYFWTFWKARSIRLKMSKGKDAKDESSSKRKQKAELKLAFMGSLMAVLTTVCAVYCLIMFSIEDGLLKSILIPLGDVVLDLYAWIHPYLLLLFSPPIQKHFKIFLRCGSHSEVDTTASVAVTTTSVVQTPKSKMFENVD